MPKTTIEFIADELKIKDIGLLCTSGTLFSKVYEELILEKQCNIYTLPEDTQEELMDCIFNPE